MSDSSPAYDHVSTSAAPDMVETFPRFEVASNDTGFYAVDTHYFGQQVHDAAGEIMYLDHRYHTPETAAAWVKGMNDWDAVHPQTPEEIRETHRSQLHTWLDKH